MNLEEIEKQQNIKFILKEQWCWDGVFKDAKKRFVVFLDKYDNYVDSTGDNWIHISDEQPVEPVYVPVKGDWGYFWNSSKNDKFHDVLIVSQIDVITESISNLPIYFPISTVITRNGFDNFKFISKQKPDFLS